MYLAGRLYGAERVCADRRRGIPGLTERLGSDTFGKGIRRVQYWDVRQRHELLVGVQPHRLRRREAGVRGLLGEGIRCIQERDIVKNVRAADFELLACRQTDVPII